MKKLIVTAALAGMMLTTAPVFAPNGLSLQQLSTQADIQADTRQIQTYLQQMQTQMDQIRRTQDPEERHRLMQAHMTSMQEGMQTIHKMSGGTLEQRVNAMEMMMGQMLEQQKVLTDETLPGFKGKNPADLKRP